MNLEDNKLCPSSTCHEGAILLGVVRGNKTVALLNADLLVDKNFVEKAKYNREPEKKISVC